MPTACAWRSRAVVPDGKLACRIVSRNVRARAGASNLTAPPAPTFIGAVEPPGQLSRTSVGRLTGSGEEPSVRWVTDSGFGVLQEIHGAGASPGL